MQLLLLLTLSVKCLLTDLVTSSSLETAASDNANALVETSPNDVESAAAYYNYNYNDPAYAQQYYQNYYGQYDPSIGPLGYRYDQYSDDELIEKQGGPTPADFIPFIASFSLPLTAALITFTLIILVSAAFLLFPQTIEIDPNSRRKRSIEENMISFPAGFCDNSSSQMCILFEKVLKSIDCVEVARCEVTQLAQSRQYPTIAGIIKPFVPKNVYERFSNMDCSAVKCGADESLWTKMLRRKEKF